MSSGVAELSEFSIGGALGVNGLSVLGFSTLGVFLSVTLDGEAVLFIMGRLGVTFQVPDAVFLASSASLRIFSQLLHSIKSLCLMVTHFLAVWQSLQLETMIPACTRPSLGVQHLKWNVDHTFFDDRSREVVINKSQNEGLKSTKYKNSCPKTIKPKSFSRISYCPQ